MNVDVYIFLKFVMIFSEFFELLCSVLRVSPETDSSRRDRSVSVPTESAAGTATVNHVLALISTNIIGLILYTSNTATILPIYIKTHQYVKPCSEHYLSCSINSN